MSHDFTDQIIQFFIILRDWKVILEVFWLKGLCLCPDEKVNLVDGKWEDIHVTTGALKMYFRELPEPLFTYALFHDFVNSISTCHIYINLIQSPAVWSKCSVWTMLLSVLSAALARQKVCVWKDYFSQKLFMEGFTFILCFFHMFKLKFGGCVFVFVYCAVWNWRVTLLCFDLESKWLMRTFF